MTQTKKTERKVLTISSSKYCFNKILMATEIGTGPVKVPSKSIPSILGNIEKLKRLQRLLFLFNGYKIKDEM